MKIDETSADPVVLAELGTRLRRHRLDRDVTQAGLAREAGVSKRTVERLEAGESAQLSSFVRVLRALDLLGNLEALVPGSLPRPMDELRLRGRQRQRASGHARGEVAADGWTWGDEP